MPSSIPHSPHSARRPGPARWNRLRRPPRTIIRFSPRSGTTSATVPIAAMPNASIRKSRIRAPARPPSPRSAATRHASLNATPAPHRSPNGAGSPPGSRGWTRAAAGGSSAPGLWWSVTISSSPRSRADPRLGDRGDAAVHADHQPVRVLPVHRAERLLVQPVPLFEPRRDVVIDLRPAQPQPADQQGRGGHAVRVVIPVDGDAAAVAHRRHDPRRRPVQPRHGLGRVQARRAGFQEVPRRGRLAQPAGDEHLGRQRGDPQPVRQRRDPRGVVRGVGPLLVRGAAAVRQTALRADGHGGGAAVGRGGGDHRRQSTRRGGRRRGGCRRGGGMRHDPPGRASTAPCPGPAAGSGGRVDNPRPGAPCRGRGRHRPTPAGRMA